MKRFKARKLIKSTKAKLLVAAALVLLLGGGAWALNGSNSPATSSNEQESATADQSQEPNSASPNLDPPTPQEKQETDEHKKSLAGPSPAPSPSPASGKKQVYPVITSANHNEVNAYVSGTIEDGGNCTASATNGSQTITGSSTGSADASSTSCARIQISLPVGTWSVVVSYSSATAEGKSQSFEVK